MKTYVLLVMVIWCGIMPSPAKIINGYEKEIHTALSSRRHLLSLPPDNNVRRRLAAVEEFIQYHQITEMLLRQFREIAPALYLQVDTIRDKKGRKVDVYIRFVPSHKNAEGTIASTNLNHLKNDKHGYVSEYGPLTVSIRILAVKHSLRILAHELGHVRYQVTNLASYLDFFSRNYADHHSRSAYLGHKPNDPSGQLAAALEKQFRLASRLYHKNQSDKHRDAVFVPEHVAKRVRQAE